MAARDARRFECRSALGAAAGLGREADCAPSAEGFDAGTCVRSDTTSAPIEGPPYAGVAPSRAPRSGGLKCSTG